MNFAKTKAGRRGPVRAVSVAAATAFAAMIAVIPSASATTVPSANAALIPSASAGARAYFFPDGSQIDGSLYVNNTGCWYGGTQNDACGGAFAEWDVLIRSQGGSWAVQYQNMACVGAFKSQSVDTGYRVNPSDGGGFADGKFLTPGWIEDYIDNPCWNAN